VQRILFTLLFVTVAAPLFAAGTSGTTVVIPIIGRFPGAGGTQWQTDVFIANPSTNTPAVTMTFYSATGPQVSTLNLGAFHTLSLRDIVLNTYGATTAAGPLEITAPTAIEARARIYNVGNPAGEFGQSAPGLGLQRLGRQAYVLGVSGINGNRVNAGVTNPNGTTAGVTLTLRSATNAILHSETFNVPPHGNVQFNDIFARFGVTPQEGVAAEFNSAELPIYGYASEVRNDTGDAIFLWGTAPNTGPN
jgi:hypothetical protein